MRFFTEHFFSEEQKSELLGDKYAQAQRAAMQTEQEGWYRTLEIAQTKERLQRLQDEFDRGAKLVELAVLPLILTITLACGLVSSFLMDGSI
ncbi:hypothetical protein FGKAn22_07210 [Ferrigenium kumadai]|uniref:Uncharacterized protein n=1 Tax=Ferrigenium kumadai TaxID=1682490 RepID=A0AAN1SXY7_9PROT|nr:hypothetical protein [Ferrigenium kumadai]BBI99028.1 hypothetical protein FGKAn22_07210 [Ferrigenium kumadai]